MQHFPDFLRLHFFSVSLFIHCAIQYDKYNRPPYQNTPYYRSCMNSFVQSSKLQFLFQYQISMITPVFRFIIHCHTGGIHGKTA